MTAAELIALAERVEGLTEADRNVGSDVLRALGYTWRGMDYWNRDNNHILKGCGASTIIASLDAVVSLIEQVLPGVTKHGYGRAAADIIIGTVEHNGNFFTSARATSPARALLAATLRAKAAEVAG